MSEHEHRPEADGAGAADQIVDHDLSTAGEALRSTVAPVEGHEVIASALRRKVSRARRTNWLVAGVATLLVAGSLGVAVTNTDPAAGSGEVASEGAGSAPAGLTSAEEIVASLPPEPIDPHEVELIASVSRYDTCDALVEELHRVGAAHVGSRGFGGNYYGIPGPYSGDVMLRADASRSTEEQSAPAMPGFGSGGDGAGGETLGTNVIVEGVDEPDSVKATATLVVELAGSALRIVDTAVPGVVGTLELAEGSDAAGEPDDRGERRLWTQPFSLLVEGRRAVVFGNESVAADPVPGDPSASRPTHDYLTVTFVDLGDPASPTITDRVRIEGGMVAVRRVGEQIRMVTSSSLADLPIVMPTSPNSVEPALHQNRLAVAGSAVEDWIPEWDRGEQTPSQPLMGCDGVVLPDTFAGVQMTSLVQFDMDGPFEPQATGLLAPSENLTATATDVVIASHVWVDPIDRADDFSDWSTALHHFRFTDDPGGDTSSGGTAPVYLASGAVDGSVRDEFSMSVLDESTVGVVTVDVVPWEERNEADITVRLLASDTAASTLGEVGSLVPEGSGTSAAGVRFIGERLLLSSGLAGNVVSAVDLSERTAPRDLGRVAMRGAGSYFHPLEGNRVLVIGPTVRKIGEVFRSGFHTTLLDLDAAPAVEGMWEMDDITSAAADDHHAFTWWPRRGMAAFGIYHHGRGNTQPPPPDAAFVTVAGDSVTTRLVTPQEADLGPRCPRSQRDRTGCDDTGPPQVNRVLVVDGQPWLYTSESLERLDPESFASTTVVPLPPRFR